MPLRSIGRDLRAMRTGVNEALKEGGRCTEGSGQARLRSALVVAELAIAVATFELALAASVIPARAATIEPMQALRNE